MTDLNKRKNEILEEVHNGTRKRLRLAGHKLTMEWSGEYGYESSSTGTCPCGWMEHGSSQEVVRDEYRFHLIDEIARHDLGQPSLHDPKDNE